MANRNPSRSVSASNLSGKIQSPPTVNDGIEEENTAVNTTSGRTSRSGSIDVTKTEPSPQLTTTIITATNVVRSSRKAFTVRFRESCLRR
jgi:hypothetical protein